MVEYMEYENVKEWLDALVDNLEQRNTLTRFNNSIRTHKPDDYIPIEDIFLVADIMGIELKERNVENSDQFNWEYSFEYRGIKFMDYLCERKSNARSRKQNGC